jgi:adenine/guanine phosphoribosyltransferase-like PRPP-binding protein
MQLTYNYGISFFDASLPVIARAYLKALPTEVTCLLSRGSSGCAIASAMLALTDNPILHHVFLKKSGEQSHSTVGGSLDHTDIVAIVDDFIDTGKTIDTLVEYLRDRNMHAECILIHHGSYGSCEEFAPRVIFPDWRH